MEYTTFASGQLIIRVEVSKSSAPAAVDSARRVEGSACSGIHRRLNTQADLTVVDFNCLRCCSPGLRGTSDRPCPKARECRGVLPRLDVGLCSEQPGTPSALQLLVSLVLVTIAGRSDQCCDLSCDRDPIDTAHVTHSSLYQLNCAWRYSEIVDHTSDCLRILQSIFTAVHGQIEREKLSAPALPSFNNLS